MGRKSNFSSFHQQNFPKPEVGKSSYKNYEIIEVKEIQHPALMEYLRTRKVETQTEFLKRNSLSNERQNYFGIGLKTILAVMKFAINIQKFVLGKKDVSTIKMIRKFENI